jgi:tripartite-type tricarboxylate transporter receptor subunit TctC
MRRVERAQFDCLRGLALELLRHDLAFLGLHHDTVAAPERLSSIPDVPTTKEAGVDFIFSAWNAMVAPKDTPKEIVEKLVAALNTALDDPAVKARYVELGSSAPQGADRGPAGLQKLVESEVARITPVIKAAGVKVE